MFGNLLRSGARGTASGEAGYEHVTSRGLYKSESEPVSRDGGRWMDDDSTLQFNSIDLITTCLSIKSEAKTKIPRARLFRPLSSLFRRVCGRLNGALRAITSLVGRRVQSRFVCISFFTIFRGLNHRSPLEVSRKK